MQWAARIPIDVFLVFAHDDAEFRDIEIPIKGLQRIKCPLDQADAFVKGFLPLSKLQLESEISTPIFGQNGRHVRPPEQMSVAFPSRHCECEANVAIGSILGYQDATAKTVAD